MMAASCTPLLFPTASDLKVGELKFSLSLLSAT